MGARQRLRSTGKGPVSREVIDLHNRHTRETYPEVKAKLPKQRERPYLFGDKNLGEA